MRKRCDAAESAFELVVIGLGLGSAEIAAALYVDLDDVVFSLARGPIGHDPMAW